MTDFDEYFCGYYVDPELLVDITSIILKKILSCLMIIFIDVNYGNDINLLGRIMENILKIKY